jgi:predicted ATPase
MTEQEKKAVVKAKPLNFTFSSSDVLYELNRNRLKNDDIATESKPFSDKFSHYIRAIGFTYSSLRAVFASLSYIGPLRTKFDRYYRVSAEMPETVGSQGEHAANLFRRKFNQFQDKINNWVKQFEFGDALEYKKLTDDVFQLNFVSGQEVTNVADAGFGASQVLPLIIQAVAAPQDSLTLAEQPEIHLNPKLQCVLADLFVEMATSGHRVLVETHSEHLIIRLRRLVAEGRIPASDVSVYFVEKAEGYSTIRKIEISANGNIAREIWPRGFFEDSLREALALSSAQARKIVEKPKRQPRANT